MFYDTLVNKYQMPNNDLKVFILFSTSSTSGSIALLHFSVNALVSILAL